MRHRTGDSVEACLPPGARIRTVRMPTFRAGTTSFAGLSPTYMASAGGTPTPDQARSQSFAFGLEMPITSLIKMARRSRKG